MTNHYSRKTLSLPPEVLTDRLRLRPLELGDEPLLWRINSDPEVMRYVMPPATDRDEHRAEYQQDLESGDRFKFFYAITWKDTGDCEGWIFLRPTEDGKSLEMGYRLQPSAWGKGLVPEAARAFMFLARQRWQAHGFIALILPGNRASQRVTEKLGFEMKGLTSEYYEDEITELWVYRY